MEVEMSERSTQSAHTISHTAHADAARRAIVHLASRLTTDVPLLGRIGVVVQEMARNLVIHAGGGELLYYQDDSRLELLAVDRGPGMVDVARCLADSYSSKGTMGAGLGAISRLSDRFDIYSQPERGTVVLAQFHLQPPAGPLISAGVSLPYPGEELCGDAWAVNGNRLLVCDGLGHGYAANEASRKARELFREHDSNLPLETLLERMHRVLTSTRGGAVALAEVLPQQAQVRFCGVGNIAGVLYDGRSRSMVSGNGTVGYRIGRIQSFSYPWSPTTVLLMASDGISTRFDLASYPGLVGRHPAVIAAVLHRDFRRHNDDATMVVMKHA
jgi:anti-sigma regulatory factor (Ser/Thr protein kinase)